MNVETILRHKGATAVTIRPETTIEAAVEILRRCGIGALVVSGDGDSVDGLLAERDIIFGLARHGAELLAMTAAEVMTQPAPTCEPEDSVQTLMAEMTNRRIRHFPVVSEGRLTGIVSIGDLVKSRLDEIEFEAHSLRSFIAGAA
ncbi:MAG: CBS domain-containing protein [Alphaproteobacteria bacterium]|nr:CBS domain-containing protein [Alphaproteobacteria bacterium]